jgi:hypothetical protein
MDWWVKKIADGKRNIAWDDAHSCMLKYVLKTGG